MTISRFALLLVSLVLHTAFSSMAIAGTCNGGPYNGQFCRYHHECKKWCYGGPYIHMICNRDFDCRKICASGVNAGSLCNVNSDCPGSGCQQVPCVAFACIGGTLAYGAVPECSDPLMGLFTSLAGC